MARPSGPEFVPEWDVYRDKDGNAVTITEDQLSAIWHAVHVVNDVRRFEGVNLLHENAGFETNAYKSRLLGRMLIQGRPPTKTRPPMSWGGPDWDALGAVAGGDPFAERRAEGERVSNDTHALIGRQVVVKLGMDDGSPVVARGKLLVHNEWGEVVLQDDMGGLQFCWPNLDIALDHDPTEQGDWP